MTPRLLDLFCGAGGAAKGYQRAGFYVVGVDIKPQPRYCGDEFVRADAMTFPLEGYDVIHASPPCQDYSSLKGLAGHQRGRLVEEVRARLIASGSEYVIENVRGAPLRNPIWLCGSMFRLGVWRHRGFEMSNPPLMVPECNHPACPEPIDCTGTGGAFSGIRKTKGGGISRKPHNLRHAREVMGIDWMTRPELSEAVPPAYTFWIGQQVIARLAESKYVA